MRYTSTLMIFICSMMMCNSGYASFIDSTDTALVFLQTHGAKLHPKCFEHLPKTEQKRSSPFLSGTFLSKRPLYDEEEQAESSGEADHKNKKKEEKQFSQEDLLAAMSFLLVTLHNSQAFSAADQQAMIDNLSKSNSINVPEVLKIGQQVEQIREEQKSWIPSTTRELLSTARQGAGGVIEVIAIVGLLILARYFKLA